MFYHGVYTSEKESAVKGMVTVSNPIFIVGTAPINMGDETNVNNAQLITTVDEATNIFGGYNVPGFTISKLLKLAFVSYGIKPVICVNVLDPENHSAQNIETDLAVVNKKVTLEKLGIMKGTVVVSDLTTPVVPPAVAPVLPLEDYSLEFLTTGELVINMFNEDVTKVGVAYDWLDPSLVTTLDIIGGIELGATNKTGLECVNDVFHKYKMIPSVIIAPQYDDKVDVIQALKSKAININNKYQAMAIAQLPEDILYSEAIEKKAELNCVYPDVVLTYGKLKNSNDIDDHSSHLACLMASVDNKNAGVPYESSSNKILMAQALVMKKDGIYKEVRLDEVTQANLLNENGISTALSRSNGFTHWGNRTSAFQPGGITDPKDMWIPAKRMFKYISNTIIINTDIEVDKPMNYDRAAFITRNINQWLDGLTAAGKLYGGRVEFTEEENPESNMINGQFTWHIYIGTVNPLESAHFILEYDSNYQKTIFTQVA